MTTDDEDTRRLQEHARVWRRLRDALRSRLRDFLDGRRPKLEIDRADAHLAACAFDGEDQLRERSVALERRLRAIEDAYADTGDARAALAACGIELREDARGRRLGELATLYRRLTEIEGELMLLTPSGAEEMRPILEPGAEVQALTLRPGATLMVRCPVSRAEAIRTLAQLDASTRYAMLRRLERFRALAGTPLTLPQAIDV